MVPQLFSFVMFVHLEFVPTAHIPVCAVKKVRKDTAANSTTVELNLPESVLANDSSNTLDSPFLLLNTFLFTFLLLSPDCSLGELPTVEVDSALTEGPFTW